MCGLWGRLSTCRRKQGRGRLVQLAPSQAGLPAWARGALGRAGSSIEPQRQAAVLALAPVTEKAQQVALPKAAPVEREGVCTRGRPLGDRRLRALPLESSACLGDEWGG